MRRRKNGRVLSSIYTAFSEQSSENLESYSLQRIQREYGAHKNYKGTYSGEEKLGFIITEETALYGRSEIRCAARTAV